MSLLENRFRRLLLDLGVRFEEQVKVRARHLEYHVDFAIWLPTGHRLAIEVDGPMHDTAKRRVADEYKDLILRAWGWEVLRIHHSEFFDEEGLLRRVKAAILEDG